MSSIAIDSVSAESEVERDPGRSQCAGQIDSLVELLRGSLSKSVMEIVTRKGEGLFPAPRAIELSCSCPDWATMCKHVAATLYGVGARLDLAPELLFTLRGVDPAEMLTAVVDRPPASAARGRVLASDDLSSIFGVDIEPHGAADGSAPAKRTRPPARSKKKGPKRRAGAKKPATKSSTKKRAVVSKAGAKRKSTTKKKTKKKAAVKQASTKAKRGAKKKKAARKKRSSMDRL